MKVKIKNLYIYFTNISFQIVLMVVGTDSVHMKEYSHVHQTLAENCQDDNIIYSSGMFHDLIHNF